MLTYLVWACYAYAAIWAVASVLFYAIDRWCSEPMDPKMSVWGAIGLGFVWPAVLAMLVHLLWLAFQVERTWRPGR